MADSVAPLGERLRELERTMASVSVNMARLVSYFGLPAATDADVDRVLAEERLRDERR